MRWPEDLLALVRESADREGVSVAQWMREAAIERMARREAIDSRALRREIDELRAEVEQLRREVRRR